MFTVGLKPLESIPPTKNAMLQHTKRVLLNVAFIWNQSELSKAPVIPDPVKWGWEWYERTKAWAPHWSDLPDASRGCSLLLHCGCQVTASVIKQGFGVAHCKCEGDCINSTSDLSI